MPGEDDPAYPRWSAAIRREKADLDDGAVGHPVGAMILVSLLAEQPLEQHLGAIVLIATPFVGEGGWPIHEFAPSSDLGSRLPKDAPVFVFLGIDDETTPPTHADLYVRAIPHALVHRLLGFDHRLNNNLRDVAQVVIGNRS